MSSNFHNWDSKNHLNSNKEIKIRFWWNKTIPVGCQKLAVTKSANLISSSSQFLVPGTNFHIKSYFEYSKIFYNFVSRRTQKTPKPQLIRPLKKSFSTEFFLRAKQWRDVAEFERKELLKVRVIRSLRQVLILYK